MAKPMKRITKSGAVRWDAQVYAGPHPDTGKPVIRWKTFEREADAKRWVREQETLKDNHIRPTTTRETFAEYLKGWLKGLEANSGLARRTLYDYRTHVQRWVLNPPEGVFLIGSIRLRDLTREAVDRLTEDMGERGQSPKAIKRVEVVLRVALNDAVAEENGRLSRNPIAATRQKRGRKGKKSTADKTEKSMTFEQAQSFREAAKSDRHSAFWHILLACGLRPSEALALSWDDLDLNAGTVSVNHSLVRVPGVKGWVLEDPKTQKSIRTVPVPSWTIDELRKWKVTQAKERLQIGAEWQDHGLVFTTATGGPLDLGNLYDRSFRRICEQAGLGKPGPIPVKPKGRPGPPKKRPFKPSFRIYDLRHTFATLGYYRAGIPIEVISEWLGHSDYAFTVKTYVHPESGAQKAAAEKMETMLG